MKTIVIHRVTSSKFGNRMKYTKEKTGPYHTSFSHSLCHCITDFFLSVDIQIVSLVIYARFLYHCPITDNPLSPIPANHSIILCKNGCKIGKTGCFLLFSTALYYLPHSFLHLFIRLFYMLFQKQKEDSTLILNHI